MGVDLSLSTNEKLNANWSKVYLITLLLLLEVFLNELEKDVCWFLVLISSGASLIPPERISLPG